MLYIIIIAHSLDGYCYVNGENGSWKEKKTRTWDNEELPIHHLKRKLTQMKNPDLISVAYEQKFTLQNKREKK